MSEQINLLNKEQRKLLLNELIAEERIELNDKLKNLRIEIINTNHKIELGEIRIRQMELRLKYQEEQENTEGKGQFSDLIKFLLEVPQTVNKKNKVTL